MVDIKSFTLDEMQEFFVSIGEKPFRAKQVFTWLNQKLVRDFDLMTDLSKTLRDKLKNEAEIRDLKIVKKLESQRDNTVKYLFETKDGHLIESVLMTYEYGRCVCVSSQAGCRMGCSFCASTLNGLDANLTAGEMAEQIYKIQEDTGHRVTHIVIMGSGEPFDNYDNTLNFIKIINSPMGLNIGQRHITVSTCGLVDKIYDFAKEDLQVTLAISLHAPNDEIRNRIMPISKKYPYEDVIKAAKYYADTTKRRVTFEYSLIKGVNDSEINARQLSLQLKGLMCHVNLIPVNDVKERGYERSNEETIKDFANILLSNNIETTVRRKLGSDINASCGQLRHSMRKS